MKKTIAEELSSWSKLVSDNIIAVNELEVDGVETDKEDVKLVGGVTPQMISKEFPGVADQRNLIQALMKMKRGDTKHSIPQMMAAADAFKELLGKDPQDTQRLMMLLKRIKSD